MKIGFDLKKAAEVQNRVFDIKNSDFTKGAWWWWFWLFFFKESGKPRQLMILWSTKNDKAVNCNDVDIIFNHKLAEETGRKKMDGAVASWYYDGKKMHHNYLLRQTPLLFSDKSLKTENPETAFLKNKRGYTVKIGDKIKFSLSLREKNLATEPTFDGKRVLNFDYEILRMNKLNFTGKFNGKKIKGSAYFQRVFLNAPAFPWYWGAFHFKNGAVLNYFRPHLGKFLAELAIKKHIIFYNRGKIYKINSIKIRRALRNGLPEFHVSGENKTAKINFVAEAYSDSWWDFKKIAFGFLPVKSRLLWHEYPAKIRKFRLVEKKTGKKVTEKELGEGIGNSEQAFGALI